MALAGTLEIQMLANMARLQKDMTQAKGMVGGAMKSIESAVSSAKSALGALGIGLGIGYFASLIKSTTSAISALDDLSESTGASVGELSKLTQQARISGVDMGTVEMALVRLGKSMHATDEESKKATRALDALGLKAADLKNMDTAQQLQIVAVAMNKFGDSSGKTALAMDLFGKSGAKVLPYLKDMANDGELAATVTAEQAAKAEELEKAVRRLANEFSNFKQAVMIDAVPALLEWVEANAKAIKIAGSATEALRLFVFNLDAMTAESPRQEIDRLTESLRKFQEAGAIGKFMQSPTGALFGGREDDLKKQIEFLKYLQVQVALKGGTGPQFMDARDLALQQKATLNYKELKKATEDSNSAYKALIKSIEGKIAVNARELQSTAKLTEGEQLAIKTMTDLRDGTLKLTEAEKINLAGRLEALIIGDKWSAQEKKAFDERAKAEEAFNVLEKKNADFLESLEKIKTDALITTKESIAQMEFETTLIGMTNVQREQEIFLRKALKDEIDAETIARGQAAIAARDAAPEAQESQVSIWKSVESAGHQAFLSIFDTSKSVLTRIRDMLKTHLIDILYQVTIKKWFINIAVGTSGAAVAQSAFGSTGGSLLSAGSMFANIPSIGTALSNFGTAFSTFSTMVGEGAGVMASFNAAAAGMGPSLMAVAPYIAAAYLAANALGIFDGDGDAQRTGNWQAGFGQPGVSSNNRWFDAQTGTGAFAGELAAAEQQMITTLGLTTAQIAAINANMTSQNIQFGFGMEHTDWSQSGAPQAIAAERFRSVAATLGISVEELTQQMVDAQKVIDLAPAKRQLEIALMEAQGDAVGALAARREDELAALDATLQPLLRQIYAAQDAAAAAEALLVTEQEAAEQAARIADERLGLQDQLDELTMTSIELLAKQRDALDESNRALFDQVQTAREVAAAAQAAAEIAREVAAAEAQLAQTRQSWQNRLDILTGATTQRQIDLAAETDAATQALMREVFAQQDLADAAAIAARGLAEAAQAAAAVASQRYGLETRLLQVQGDTSALRLRELALLDESNRPLQERIWALEDQAVADAAAAQAAAEMARAAQQAADQQQRAAEQIKNAWLSAAEAIINEANRLRGLMGITPQSLAQAQAQFAILTAQARAGDIEAAKMLPGVASSIVDLTARTATSSISVQRARGQLAGSLDTTADIVAAIQGLKAELAAMRKDTRKTADLLTRVTQDGNSMQTTAV